MLVRAFILAAGMGLAPLAKGTIFTPVQKTHDTGRTEKPKPERTDIPPPTRAADERIACYTLWLTSFTGVLVLVSGYQGWQLKRTVSAMERQGVQISREFVATHRPRLTIRQIAYVHDEDDPAVRYTIANIGLSKARIIEGSIRAWVMSKHVEWPAVPPYSADPLGVGATEIDAGGWIDREYHDSPTNLHLLMGNAELGLRDTMLLGYVVYTDENNVRRRMGFCRKRTGGGHRFEPVGDPDYEYAD